MPANQIGRLSRIEWFRKKPNGDDSSALAPAKAVLSNREKWARDAVAEAGLEKDVTEIYRTTKDELEEELKRHEEAMEARRSLEMVKHRKSSWNVRRQEGKGKFGRSLQGFLTTTSAFLQSYSGIVELVKVADNQYGGLAYGTLSLFLSVAVHKDHHEDAIEDALRQLTLDFPRLEILEDVYPTPEMQSLIAQVYQQVIVFARDCVHYFTRSSIGRIMRSGNLLDPVSQVIDSIRELLVEVRRESETLLQARILEIFKVNQRMEKELTLLRAQVGEMDTRDMTRQDNEDKRNLNRLRELLIIPSTSKHTDIASYRKLLQQAFPAGVTRQQPRTKLLAQAELEREEMYREWRESLQSCILLLYGKNWSGDVSTTTLNWLSSAACIVAEQCRTTDHIVAHYFCQVDYLVKKDERVSIQELISSVLYQILAHRPTLLSSGEVLQTLKETLSSKDWLDDNNDISAMESGFDCLLELLKLFGEDDKITLVLDRMDNCYCGGEELSANDTLEGFLQIVQEAPCRVNILLVAGPAWKLSKAQSEKLERKGGSQFLHRKNWHYESPRVRELTPDVEVTR